MYRLGSLGQVLPTGFEKMSAEEMANYVNNLPKEQRSAVITELFDKLPLATQLEFLGILRSAAQFKTDATVLFATTVGSFLYDAFVMVPLEYSTKGKRTAAYLGSSLISGATAFQAFKVLNNPVSGAFVKVISAFVGVFTSVDALLRIIAILKSEKTTQSSVLSPKTAMAVAFSRK